MLASRIYYWRVEWKSKCDGQPDWRTGLHPSEKFLSEGDAQEAAQLKRAAGFWTRVTKVTEERQLWEWPESTPCKPENTE